MCVYSSLGLTVKKEQESKTDIHFLDLRIAIADGDYRTTVYRKSGSAPLYIPMVSEDGLSLKKAAFSALFRRAYTHCSNYGDRSEEINTIMGIGRQHGYEKKFLRKLLNEVERSLCKVKTRLSKSGSFRCIDQALWIEKFAKNIRGLTNCTLYFRRNPTVFLLFSG